MQEHGYKFINLAYLYDVADGEPEFIAQMINAYLQFATEDMEEVLTTAKIGNWEATGKAVHKMKSAAESMGIRKLGELAKEIEYAIREAHNQMYQLPNPDQVKEKIALMEQIFDLACLEYRAELKRLLT